MRAERFGSYSIDATLAGTPSLFRLKSIMRYFRLCPPPLCLMVMRPLLLRPPELFSGAVKDFSGLVLVISSNVETVIPRRPGVVGLYFFTAMIPSLLIVLQKLQCCGRRLKLRQLSCNQKFYLHLYLVAVIYPEHAQY